MDSVSQKARRHGLPTQADLRWSTPAGLKILVPGYVQWSWRQRERAAVLFGSFAVALGVGTFAWGTRTGLAVLAFAFGTHVVSAVDVIRQSAFPAFGRWMPWLSASGGLAVGVYAPTLVVASLVAWPAIDGVSGLDGYLVNCWAYRNHSPSHDDWVWVRPSPWGELQVGRVLAVPGEEVEWSKNQLRINGSRKWIGSPFGPVSPPQELSFVVPRGHVLVNPVPSARQGITTDSLVLVPREQIGGRAWARMYPFWERQLLR